jgi:hypothetical protein
MTTTGPYRSRKLTFRVRGHEGEAVDKEAQRLGVSRSDLLRAWTVAGIHGKIRLEDQFINVDAEISDAPASEAEA